MENERLAVKEMYKKIKTSVKVDGQLCKEFEVKVEVHQGSVLSSLLFAMMMAEVTKEIKIEV